MDTILADSGAPCRTFAPGPQGEGTDSFDLLLARLGQPLPCSLCGALTPSDQFTESFMPSGAINFGGLTSDIVTHRAARLCPACPKL